ncbi:MAG: hypothetical protein CTR54_00510 [Rhizobium sp.]|nr:MAG: hypothetical protein CTR54_00510 [Rhizobium sp.]
MAIQKSIVLAHFAIFLLLIVAVWVRPAGPFVLVVTDPEKDASGNMQVIGDAGGRLVWSGRYAWVSVAYSDANDFAGRLMRAGALLVLNHDLAVGCLEGN